MDQLNPESQNRPKMANYVLLSFGSDGGLNQPNGTGREQIILNDREEHVSTSNNSTLQRVLSERPTSSKRTKRDSPKEASPSLQDLEKAQLELENQLDSERRESIRPKSANISTLNPTQNEPKKPERKSTMARRAKSTIDTGTQSMIIKHYNSRTAQTENNSELELVKIELELKNIKAISQVKSASIALNTALFVNNIHQASQIVGDGSLTCKNHNCTIPWIKMALIMVSIIFQIGFGFLQFSSKDSKQKTSIFSFIIITVNFIVVFM